MNSSSTWLSAVINALQPKLFRNFNEPLEDVINEIENGAKHFDSETNQQYTFVGSKNKIQQLSPELQERIANGQYKGKVIFLHRQDSFKHA
jgi:protein-arginine kinase activator protein McsA